jgi:MFS family permease
MDALASRPLPSVEAEAAEAVAQDTISAAQRRGTLALLTTVYVASYVDRRILEILLEPIKDEFALSDTQLGFLSGVSFALFYATLGVPLSILADRYSRKRIIVVSLAIFALMTTLCGFAASFAQLVLLRVLVGVGEAGTSPQSHSIIADLYPPSRRSTPIAIYGCGINAGLFLGYIIGGVLTESTGWRAAFKVIGVPGLVLVLVTAAFLREPPRGYSDTTAAGAAAAGAGTATGAATAAGGPDGKPVPLPQVLRVIWNCRSLFHIFCGTVVYCFTAFGNGAFTPSFLSRSHNMAPTSIGLLLAIISGVLGLVGTYGVGWLADNVSRKKDDQRWSMWLVAAALVVNFVFGGLGLLVRSTPLAIACMVVQSCTGAAYFGPSTAMMQTLVPTRMRSTTSGLSLFFLNFLGFGLGPQSVGLLSDMLLPTAGVDSLRYAMLVLVFGHLWAAVHYWLAARTLCADLALLAADEGRWEKVMMAGGGGGGSRGYQQLDRLSTLPEERSDGSLPPRP